MAFGIDRSFVGMQIDCQAVVIYVEGLRNVGVRTLSIQASTGRSRSPASHRETEDNTGEQRSTESSHGTSVVRSPIQIRRLGVTPSSHYTSRVDFLLECVGFSPDYDRDGLIERILSEGESIAWRGTPERHRQLSLGSGLELRMDREADQERWTIWPHYQVSRRLRIAVENVRSIPDSPFDALLTGWAAPPWPGDDAPPGDPGAYRLATNLCDGRRLPRELSPNHVLAISVAGFALDVSYLGPNVGVKDPRILERESGAWIEPLGQRNDPGGCSEVSLRIISLRHLRNPITGVDVDLLQVDAPGRPLDLFLSRWQLEKDGLPAPRPGYRIEGTFLFNGRVAGGIPTPRAKQRAFG